MIAAADQRPVTSAVLVAGLALLCCAGCGAQLDTTYGRSRGQSINGTGVVAELFRESGHEVRTAVRLTDELDDWADVIVRFAPRPGPPERDEADWYDEWLSHERGRRARLRPPRLRRAGRLLVRRARGAARRTPRPPSGPVPRSFATRPGTPTWPAELPPEAAKEAAGPEDWFAVEVPKASTPEVCKVLAGPWGRGHRRRAGGAAAARDPQGRVGDGAPDRRRPAAGHRVDPAQRQPGPGRGQRCLPAQRGAGQPRPAAPGAAGGRLGGRGAPEGGVRRGRRRARRRAGRAVDLRAAAASRRSAGWPRRCSRSAWRRAWRGRPGSAAPAPDPPSDEDRPAAHAEALGALLARTGQAEQARRRARRVPPVAAEAGRRRGAIESTVTRTPCGDWPRSRRLSYDRRRSS